MFFLLAIWDFIFILGLFYTFLIFWIAFHRYTTFGRCGGPEKDQVFGVPLGLCFYDLSPQIRRTSWISLGIMVTLFACTVQRLESSRRPTRYAS